MKLNIDKLAQQCLDNPIAIPSLLNGLDHSGKSDVLRSMNRMSELHWFINLIDGKLVSRTLVEEEDARRREEEKDREYNRNNNVSAGWR